MPKLSIIVPVYNVEKYLRKCVDSILNQTLVDFEVILIDDGSPDNCGKICDEYAKKDNRVRVIHKENGGLSSARNRGINIAKGKYITFVDSDDFLGVDNAYEEMITELEKNSCKVAVGKSKYFYEDTNTIVSMERYEKIFDEKKISVKKYLIESIRNSRIYVPVCFYIYDREFLKREKIFFEEGIYHEDELFSNRALLRCNEIILYSNYMYVYRQREGSIIRNSNKEKICKDIYNVCLKLEKEIEGIEDRELRIWLLNYISVMAFNTSKEFKKLNIPKDIKKVINYGRLSNGYVIRAKFINFNEKLYYILDDIYEKTMKKLRR